MNAYHVICNTGISDISALFVHAYISGKALISVLQILHVAGLL